jgi:hypothetical protein
MRDVLVDWTPILSLFSKFLASLVSVACWSTLAVMLILSLSHHHHRGWYGKPSACGRNTIVGQYMASK